MILSTSEDRKILRVLAGVPSGGPTVLVGNHMLMGFELAPQMTSFLAEKNIVVRGLAHPILFYKPNGKLFPDSLGFMHVLMGAVPVSGPNLFKLLASNSHVLLYPGGAKDALHWKV